MRYYPIYLAPVKRILVPFWEFEKKVCGTRLSDFFIFCTFWIRLAALVVPSGQYSRLEEVEHFGFVPIQLLPMKGSWMGVIRSRHGRNKDCLYLVPFVLVVYLESRKVIPEVVIPCVGFQRVLFQALE